MIEEIKVLILEKIKHSLEEIDKLTVQEISSLALVMNNLNNPMSKVYELLGSRMDGVLKDGGKNE